MRITITWPHGTCVEFEEDTTSMSPDGVDTLLRQVHDLACAALAAAVELGVEETHPDCTAEVEVEVEADEAETGEAV